MNAPFSVPNTPDNHALAAVVERRLQADAKLIRATAAFWRLLGAGGLLALACVGAGIGAGMAFRGFADIVHPPAEVRVVPRPTAQQIQPDTTPPSHAAVVSEYTIFHRVQVEGGEVISGWDFKSSADQRPALSYCYFAMASLPDSRLSIRIDIAQNGQPNAGVERDLPTGVTLANLLTNCVWWTQ